MADREFRILINGDAAGITTASARGGEALKDMGEAGSMAQKQITEGAEKTEGVHKLLHGSVKLLGHEFRDLGGLAHYVFSPWTAGLGAVLIGVRLIEAAHERAKTAAMELGAANAQAFIAMRNAESDAASKALDWITQFKQETEALKIAQETAVASSAGVVSAINAQAEALTALANARKEFELSQAKDAEKRQEIEARYKSFGRTISSGAEASIIGAKQQELSQAEARQAALSKATAEALANSSGDAGTHREKLIASYKNFLDETQKRLDQAEKDTELAKGGSGWDKAASRRDLYQNEIKQTQDRIRELEAEASEAKAALDRAKNAELANQKVIAERSAEIPGLHALYDVHRATAGAQSAYENAGQAGQAFTNAAARITANASKGDLPGFIRAVEEMSLWPAKWAQMVDVIHDADQALSNSIKNLQKRTASLEGTRAMYPPVR